MLFAIGVSTDFKTFSLFVSFSLFPKPVENPFLIFATSESELIRQIGWINLENGTLSVKVNTEISASYDADFVFHSRWSSIFWTPKDIFPCSIVLDKLCAPRMTVMSRARNSWESSLPFVQWAAEIYWLDFLVKFSFNSAAALLQLGCGLASIQLQQSFISAAA